MVKTTPMFMRPVRHKIYDAKVTSFQDYVLSKDMDYTYWAWSHAKSNVNLLTVYVTLLNVVVWEAVSYLLQRERGLWLSHSNGVVQAKTIPYYATRIDRVIFVTLPKCQLSISYLSIFYHFNTPKAWVVCSWNTTFKYKFVTWQNLRFSRMACHRGCIVV